MNKFGVIVALSAVLVGLVAISSVSGNLVSKKFVKDDHFEHETGELEKPHRHHYHHVEHKGPVHKHHHHHHKAHQPNRAPHYRPKPKHHPKKSVKKQPPHHPHYPVCGNGGHTGGHGGYEGGSEGGQGGFEGGQGGNEGGQGGFEGGHGGSEGGRGDHESGGDEFEQGGESWGEGEGEGEAGQESEGEESGNDSNRRQGSFKGAGVFGGFKKSKEFDAGVKTGSKQKNRATFQKQRVFVAGENDSVNGGSSRTDVNTSEGVRRHKSLNNDKVFVKESNRGTDDTDAFRNQSGRTEEEHFGASNTKLFGAGANDSASAEQENEKDLDANVHKKSDVGAFGGAGVVKGQF